MKYMVALDGSDHSAKALALAYRFVKDDDTLVLLTVGHWNPSKLREFFDESGLANAKTNLQKQCDDLIAAKLAEAKQHVKNVIGKVEFGQPRVVICEQAEREGIDVLIVGERGLGTVQRMLLGSVSDYVMKHAACDVLIAKGALPCETEPIEPNPPRPKPTSTTETTTTGAQSSSIEVHTE